MTIQSYLDQGFVPVFDNNDYLIDRAGTIVSTKGTAIRVLKPQPKKNGYPKVNLYVDKKPVTKHIHRIVAEKFVPNPDNHTTVRHIDNDKENYHADNLQWGTHCDNMSDEVVSGRAAQRAIKYQETKRDNERYDLELLTHAHRLYKNHHTKFYAIAETILHKK